MRRAARARSSGLRAAAHRRYSAAATRAPCSNSAGGGLLQGVGETGVGPVGAPHEVAPVRRAAGEVGRAPVQGAPPGGREAPVHGVADQGGPEGEDLVGLVDLRLEEPLPHRRGAVLGHRVVAGQGAQDVHRRRLAQDGQGLERLPGPRRGTGQPPPQARGERSGRARAPEPVAACEVGGVPVGEHRPQVHRVAVGLLAQARDRPRRHVGVDLPGQLGDLGVREAAEGQPHGVLGPRVAGRGLEPVVGPVVTGEHGHHAQRGQAPQQPPQRRQRLGVRAVQVVRDEQHRPAVGQLLEGGEQRRRPGSRRSGRDVGGAGAGRARGREAAFEQRAGAAHLDVGGHRADHGHPVGTGRTVGTLDVPAQAVHQLGLADPRRPGDQDRGRGGGPRPPRHVEQTAELGGTTDTLHASSPRSHGRLGILPGARASAADDSGRCRPSGRRRQLVPPVPPMGGARRSDRHRPGRRRGVPVSAPLCRDRPLGRPAGHTQSKVRVTAFFHCA